MSLLYTAEQKLNSLQNNPVPQSLGTASMQSNFEVQDNYGEIELKRMRLKALWGEKKFNELMSEAKQFFEANKHTVIHGKYL